MALLSIGNMITWGVAAIICAYVAQKKGKRTHLALFMGLLFGMFAMIYYLFCKSNDSKWQKKHSWYMLGGYILFIIVVSIIEVLLGV